MNQVTNVKHCYCHTCKKPFHYLGIARHRVAHKERGEDCLITYTHGDTHSYNYADKQEGRVKAESRKSHNEVTKNRRAGNG